MRTNIDIDDKLMKDAMKASRLETKTKKAVVEEALQLLVNSRAREGLWKLFGKVQFWDGYDYKAMRGDTNIEFEPVKTKLKTRAPQRTIRSAKRRAA
jgi:hypothetical protein